MALSWFFQAHQIVRRKSSADVSLPFLLVFLVGGMVWIAYGLQVNSFPVILANTVGTVGVVLTVFLFFKYSKTKNMQNGIKRSALRQNAKVFKVLIV